MEKVIGPDCPRCGCESSTVVSETTWWGKLVEKRQCDHCGTQFNAAPEVKDEKPGKIVVRWQRLRCPNCGSTNVVTQGTRGRFRSHKCRDCTKPFQSVEE